MAFSPQLLARDLAFAQDFSEQSLARIAKRHGHKEGDVPLENRGYARITQLALASLGNGIPLEAISKGVPAFSSKYQDYHATCTKLRKFLFNGAVPKNYGNIINFLRKSRPDCDPNKPADAFTADWQRLVLSTYPHVPLRMLISNYRVTTMRGIFITHVNQQRTDNDQVAQLLYKQLSSEGAYLLAPDHECHVAMRIHSVDAIIRPNSTSISWDELMLEYGEHFPEQRGRIHTILSQLAPFYCLTQNRMVKNLRLPFNRNGRSLMSFQEYVWEISSQQIGDAFGCSLNSEVKECLSHIFKESDLFRSDCLEFLAYPKQELPCDRAKELKKNPKYQLLISCRVIMNYLNEQISHSMQPSSSTSNDKMEEAINELILWTLKRKEGNYYHMLDSSEFPKMEDPPLNNLVSYVNWVKGLAPFYGNSENGEQFLPNALRLLLSFRGLNDNDGLREKETRNAFMAFVSRCCKLPYIVITTKAVEDCSIHERDKTFREKLDELETFLHYLPPNLTGKAPRFFDWISKKKINSAVKALIKEACSGRLKLIERIHDTNKDKIDAKAIELFIQKIHIFNTAIGLQQLESQKGKEQENVVAKGLDAHLYFEALFAFLDGKVQSNDTSYEDALLAEFQELAAQLSKSNSSQNNPFNLFPENFDFLNPFSSRENSYKKPLENNDFELLQLYDSLEDRLKMIPLIAQAADDGLYYRSEHAKFIAIIALTRGYLTNPTKQFFEVVDKYNRQIDLEDKIQQLNQMIKITEIREKAQKLDSDIYFNVLGHFLNNKITLHHLEMVTQLHSWESGRAEMLGLLPKALENLPIQSPLELVKQMPQKLVNPSLHFFSLVCTWENSQEDPTKVEKFNRLIGVADEPIDSYIYYSNLKAFLDGQLNEKELQLVQFYDWKEGKKEAMLKAILAASQSDSLKKLKENINNFIELTQLLSQQKLSAPTPGLLSFPIEDSHDFTKTIKEFNTLINIDREKEEVDYSLYLKGLQLFSERRIAQEHVELLNTIDPTTRDADTTLRLLIEGTNRMKWQANETASPLTHFNPSNLGAIQAVITAFEECFGEASVDSKRTLSTHRLSPLKLPLSPQQLQQATHIVKCNKWRLSEEERLYLFYELLTLEPSLLSINDRLIASIADFTGFPIDGSTFCYFFTYHPNFDQDKALELLRTLCNMRQKLFKQKTFFAQGIVQKIKKNIKAFIASIEDLNRNKESAKEDVPPKERLDMVKNYLHSATLPLVMSADSIPISSDEMLYFSPSSPHQQCQFPSQTCTVGRYETWIKEGNYYRYCVNCFSPDMSRNVQGSARLAITAETLNQITTLWPLIQELVLLFMNEEFSQKIKPNGWQQLLTHCDRAANRWTLFTNSYLRLKQPSLPFKELEVALMQFFVDLKQTLRCTPIALATCQQPTSFSDPIVAAASGTLFWNHGQQAHQLLPSSLLQAASDQKHFFTTAAEMEAIQSQLRHEPFIAKELPLFVTQNGIEELPLHFNIIQRLVNNGLSIELTSNKDEVNIFVAYPRDIAYSKGNHLRVMSWQLGLLKALAYQSIQIEGMKADHE